MKSATFLQFGHQIHIKVVIAGGGSRIILLAGHHSYMLIERQPVGYSEVTHRPLVVQRDIGRVCRIITCSKERRAFKQTSKQMHMWRTAGRIDTKDQWSAVVVGHFCVLMVHQSGGNKLFQKLKLHTDPNNTGDTTQ